MSGVITPQIAFNMIMATHCGLSPIKTTDECIRWPHAHDRDGYGQLWSNGRKVGVHILACERAHGPRPEGTEVAHSCHVPDCINPRHLSWKTHAENNHDKIANGTSSTGTRLTPTKVGALHGWPLGSMSASARFSECSAGIAGAG
jgi:hypothetical protein